MELQKTPILLSGLLFLSLLLGACQTLPPEPAAPSENDVCVGEPIVVEEGKDVDLEALANEAECLE